MLSIYDKLGFRQRYINKAILSGATSFHKVVNQGASLADITSFSTSFYLIPSVKVTALQYALLQNDVDSVYLLLAMGVDPNEAGALGYYPFELACLGGNKQIMLSLLYAGVEISIPDFLRRGRRINFPNVAQVLTYLIEQVGRNVNERDKYGCIGLHYIVETNRLELAEYLLQKGSDPNIHDNQHLCSLTRAVNANTPSTMDMVQLLLSYDANINNVRAVNVKPHILTTNHIKRGINSSTKNDLGQKYTHIAAQSLNSEFEELFEALDLRKMEVDDNESSELDVLYEFRDQISRNFERGNDFERLRYERVRHVIDDRIAMIMKHC